MRPRIAAEVALLRECYPDIEHVEHAGEDWFRLPAYLVPVCLTLEGKEVSAVPIAFKVSGGYPVDPPYGFAVPLGVTIRGSEPQNAAATAAPPFGGTWRLFSWAPDGWTAASDVRYGSNLVKWVRSFAQRLGEGP